MAETDTNGALPPGYRLEEFEIINLLGEGGFGLAYLAYDHILKQQRAIKEFLPNAVARRGRDGTRVSARTGENRTAYEEGLRSFINEARLLASLDHPNVVRVYRCLEANNTAYLVMHYYRGETLKQRMARFGETPPDAEWVIRLLTQLLHGLRAVHSQGVLHRDIKPSNVYLLADDRPVLIDFGAARRVVGGHTRALTGVVSAGYSPIEQYAGDSGVQEGPWTDFYALGATFYQLVTSRKPWNAVMRMTADDLKPAVDLGRRHYPGVLLATIDHALKLQPRGRFQTAAEWLAVLEGKAAPPSESRFEGTTVKVAPRNLLPSGLFAKAFQMPSPKVRRITLIGFALLLMTIGTGAYFLSQRDRLPSLPLVEPVTTSLPPISVKPPAAPPEPVSISESGPAKCPVGTASISDVMAQGRQSLKQGDYAVALLCYRLAAERGNAEAQHHLGLLYESGLGVEQDTRQAAHWYRQAADQGYADAQTGLGLLHEAGDGVAQDTAEAIKWYRLAANQGHPRARERLTKLEALGRTVTPASAPTSVPTPTPPSAGCPTATGSALEAMAKGQEYVRQQNPAAAGRCYRVAADLGNAEAQYNLGILYEHGLGIAQDSTEAVKWYRQAAEQGYAAAQLSLGVLYEIGGGVTQDYAEAVKWYRQAAAQGDALAQNNLGWLYETGHGVTQNSVEAVKWYRQAAAQGNARAQAHLKRLQK